MQAEPLIHWPEPILEYIGFVAQFVALGAIGFRYAAVRDRLPLGPNTLHAPDDSERATYARALRRAATLGLFGALVSAALFAYGLPEAAERAKTTVQGLLTTNVRAGAQAALLTIGVLGLLLASTGRRIGWPAALLGMTVAPLTALFVGQWIRLVNPVHRVAGGYWIGTLFVLLVVGIASVWRETPNGGRRGAMVADMVHGFSPLALVAGATVAGSGLITAWRHLNPLASLWTTPYGYALHGEARARRGRVRAGRLELAPPASDARQRRGGAVRAPLGARGGDRRGARAGRLGDRREPAVAPPTGRAGRPGWRAAEHGAVGRAAGRAAGRPAGGAVRGSVQRRAPSAPALVLIRTNSAYSALPSSR